MGTNYYWNPGVTDALKAFGSVHVGKSSGGWSFNFKGYRFCPGETVSADLGQGPQIALDARLLAFTATSWLEWKALLSRSGTIEDEYGQTISFDEFVQSVEQVTHPDGKWNGNPLQNHVTYLRTDPRYRGQAQFQDETQYWLDAAGYSFSIGEFS